MAKETLFYVETGRGGTLKANTHEHRAYNMVLREVGTDIGIRTIREATSADIEWVRSMGGRVPELA